MIRGYARVSTQTQNIDVQVNNILKIYPEAKIYKEVFSGKDVYNRKQFKRLLRESKPGDTIVFDSVSRMSRNTEEGVKLYFELYEKGINLVFLKDSYINTEVYKKALEKQVKMTGNNVDLIILGINKYLKEVAKEQVYIAFEQAEKERKDISRYTSEGIREAKRKGKQIGQVKGAKLNIKKKAPAKEKIREYSRDFDGTLKDADVMKIVGISNNTYYKYKKELLEELREQEEAG